MGKHSAVGGLFRTCSRGGPGPISVASDVFARSRPGLAVYTDQIAAGAYSVSWIGQYLLCRDGEFVCVDVVGGVTCDNDHGLFRPHNMGHQDTGASVPCVFGGLGSDYFILTNDSGDGKLYGALEGWGGQG